MRLGQLPEYIKAAGFEEWSWVAGALAVPLAVWALVLAYRQLRQKPPAPTQTLHQSGEGAHAHVGGSVQAGGAVQIGGHSVVHQHLGLGPELVEQLLDRISAKDRELGQKDARVSILSAENAQLREQAVQTVVQQSQSPQANPAAQRAVAALQEGRVEEAQRLLRALEDRAAAAALPHREAAAQHAREQAALQIGRDTEAAYLAFERAAGYEPHDVWTLFELARLALLVRDSGHALAWAQRAHAACISALQAAPDDCAAQRNASVARNRIADVLLAQGDASAALGEYQKSLVIAEKLAASDPKNTQWQRDVAVSHAKLGEVFRAMGQKAAARAAFARAKVLVERLVALDPNIAQSQADLLALNRYIEGLNP